MRSYRKLYDLRLGDLAAVVAVAEERHIGHAAARLELAQPHLSRLLKRVEAKLGLKLFRRRPRISLTSEGTIVSQACRAILMDVELALRRAKLSVEGQAGTLRVGFASTMVFTPILDSFKTYRFKHPSVHVSLKEMFSSEQLEAVRSGLLEVAITSEKHADNRLSSDLIFREPFVVALPRRHPLASQKRVSIAKLAREPFVVCSREIVPVLFDQIISACADGGFSPRIVQEADEWHSAIGFVRAGSGVCIVPAGVGRVKWEGVAFRALTGTTAASSLYASWLPERQSGLVAEFVTLLKQGV